MKRVEQLGSFTARDADGTTHVILILQTVEVQGGREVERGPVGLWTTAGLEVSRSDRGKYQILAPRRGAVEVTAAGPDAP